MPKKKNKNNGRDVAEDFDVMLADFRAADLTNAPSKEVPPITADNTPPVKAAKAQAPKKLVPQSTMFAAIRAGDLTRLRRWHRSGVEMSGDNLCMAAALGQLVVARCMIEEFGADVNKAAQDGVFPVYVASLNGHLDFVRFVVKMFGANVNKTNFEGATPLIGVAELGLLDMIRCLVKELGASVDLRRHDDGMTALMIAAHHGQVDTVRCLVKEFGADVSIATREGDSALIVAAQNGHLDVVQCLVNELDADVNFTTLDGRTALMVASHGKHGKVIRWLMKHGADPSATCMRGNAADASRDGGAPIAQTEYLEAKAHCSNPGCDGAGLKKCTGCKQARYCGQTCQLAHWKAHKANCNARQML
jgi:hypothetical protein